MAVFSYIGDHTTNENRALNIAVIDGIMILIANGGTYLGGYTMQNYGTTVPYYIILCVNAVSVVYVLVVIKDTKVHGMKFSHICHPGTLFSWRRVKEGVNMLLKQRPRNARTNIILVLVCMFIASACLMGDGSLVQLFLEFHPFNWTIAKYSLYSSIQGITAGLTLMVMVFVMRKVFGIPDATLAMVACLSAILFFYGFSVATSDWMIYVSSAMGILKMICIVSVRSILAGMVDADEIGKMMAAVSSMHALTPLVGSAIFSNIFAATNAWWPGLCFAVGSFAMVPVLGMFAYVDLSQRGLM